MQICAEAKRLFDRAQREPDKKKSRADSKRAQQWLDDYSLHTADMVGAVQEHAAPIWMLCVPSVPVLGNPQDRWLPAHRVIRCHSMTCTVAHQQVAHPQQLQGSALSLCLAACKHAAFALRTSPQCAVKPLRCTGCQMPAAGWSLAHSSVLLQTALAGFNIECCYQLVYPDALHNTSLGLAHHLMGIITDKLHEADAFDEVDQRLRELAKTAFPELNLPAKGLSSKDITAAERQSLAKCLPVALLDCQGMEDCISALVGEATGQRPVLWTGWYCTATKDSHSLVCHCQLGAKSLLLQMPCAPYSARLIRAAYQLCSVFDLALTALRLCLQRCGSG